MVNKIKYLLLLLTAFSITYCSSSENQLNFYRNPINPHYGFYSIKGDTLGKVDENDEVIYYYRYFLVKYRNEYTENDYIVTDSILAVSKVIMSDSTMTLVQKDDTCYYLSILYMYSNNRIDTLLTSCFNFENDWLYELLDYSFLLKDSLIVFTKYSEKDKYYNSFIGKIKNDNIIDTIKILKNTYHSTISKSGEEVFLHTKKVNAFDSSNLSSFIIYDVQTDSVIVPIHSNYDEYNAYRPDKSYPLFFIRCDNIDRLNVNISDNIWMLDKDYNETQITFLNNSQRILRFDVIKDTLIYYVAESVDNNLKIEKYLKRVIVE